MKTKLKLVGLALTLVSSTLSANDLCKEVSFQELQTYKKTELVDLYVTYAKKALAALQEPIVTEGNTRAELLYRVAKYHYVVGEVALCTTEQKRLVRLVGTKSKTINKTLENYSIDQTGVQR